MKFTLLILSTLLLSGMLCSAEKRPNVVIFFTDDQGTLDANCYGSEDLYTPAIDKLAETGVLFTQAYSHLYCCPARAMLLTGRQPQRVGIHNWAQGRPFDRGKTTLNRDETTLAEALREAGYKTAIFGKWHLGADEAFEPTEHGFEEFFGHRSGFIDNYRHYYLHGKGFHDLYEGKEEVYRKGDYFPDMVTGRALDYIEANQNNPFFLYLAFNIPHYPEQADPKFDERYKGMAMPRRDYAKTISTVDDRMGQVMEKLNELGLRENTIIIFQSDNGHSAEDYQIKHPEHASGLPLGLNYGPNKGSGNTGKWIGAKGTFYEGGIRVPSIVSYPKSFPQGVVRDQPVTAMDWMPTVLKLCGIKRPDLQFDGHDILPVIQNNRPSPNTVMHWQWVSLWAIRKGDWKLVQNRNTPLALYNLSDEKPEQINHMDAHPEIVARLQALHDEWAQEVAPPGPEIIYELDRHDDRQLKNAGVKRLNNKGLLFTGEDTPLRFDSGSLSALVGKGFVLTVNVKVDKVAGTLFECGDTENRVALYIKDNHLLFSITAGGRTKELRSPDKLVQEDWAATTAEVDSVGHMYLIVKGQDPVHQPGPGLFTFAPQGPIRMGQSFTGRIIGLEIQTTKD